MAVLSEEKKKDAIERLNSGKDVYLGINKKCKTAGILAELRKIFPDNYIYKYVTTINGERLWMYKICAGDKEFQEMMHAPLPGFEAMDWAAKGIFTKKVKEQLINGIKNKGLSK